jgi:hypothetical protein
VVLVLAGAVHGAVCVSLLLRRDFRVLHSYFSLVNQLKFILAFILVLALLAVRALHVYATPALLRVLTTRLLADQTPHRLDATRERCLNYL